MKVLGEYKNFKKVRGTPLEGLARMPAWRWLYQPVFWRMHADVLLLLALFLLPLPQLIRWLVLSEAGFSGARDPGSVASQIPHFISYLALAILPLLAWGAWLALHALADVAVNHCVARLVRENIDQQLSQVRKGEKALDLEMLKQGQGIVPDNRSTPAVAMVQMFENIRQQAHEYRFDAGTIVVQPYQQFSLMGLAGLEGVQKLALRLGILGAFLGLLFAIRIIPTTLNDMANLRLRVEQHSQTRANASRPAEQVADPDSLRQLDQKQWNLFIGMGSQVFEALSIKFGSSIAGLYVAVGVSLFASALRRRLRLYFQDMEDAAIHFTLLASRAENKTSLRLDFERLREEMQRMRETVHDKSVDLLGQIRTISAHLEVQIQKIEEGMTRLATARGTLEGFLCALDQKQNRFLDDISRSYQAASLSHELMEIRSALSSDQQALSRDVTERIGKLRSELIELHNAMAGRPASLLPEPAAKMALGGGGAMLPMDYAPPASLAPPGFLGRIKRWFSST